MNQIIFTATWSSPSREAAAKTPDVITVIAKRSGRVVFTQSMTAAKDERRLKVMQELRGAAEQALAGPEVIVVKPRTKIAGPLSNNDELAKSMLAYVKSTGRDLDEVFAEYIEMHGIKQGRAAGIRVKLDALVG